MPSVMTNRNSCGVEDEDPSPGQGMWVPLVAGQFMPDARAVIAAPKLVFGSGNFGAAGPAFASSVPEMGSVRAAAAVAAVVSALTDAACGNAETTCRLL